MSKLILTIWAVLALAVAANAHAQTQREARLGWKPIAGAKTYEVELSANSQFDPVIGKQSVKEPQASFKLAPGTYYFRIRAFDKAGTPGVWSEIQGFVVNPHPPALVTPDDRKQFTQRLSEDGIELGWRSGVEGTRYQIEIKDKAGVVLRRSVDGTTYRWKPSDPGRYEWRVGFETQVGIEWSKPREFSVTPSAIESRVAAPSAPMQAAANCSQPRWARFQTNGILVTQESGGKSYSGQLAWNPSCSISRNFGLELSLGGTMLKAADGAENFKVAEYLGWVTVSSGALVLGLGFGAQTWLSSGTYTAPSAMLAWHSGGWISRVFVSYSSVNSEIDPARTIRLGVVLDLGRKR